MASTIKCENFDKVGWAGLRKYTCILEANGSSPYYTIPTGAFKPTAVISLSVRFSEDVFTDPAAATFKAAWGYYNVATGELKAYSASTTQLNSKYLYVELILMGN